MTISHTIRKNTLNGEGKSAFFYLFGICLIVFSLYVFFLGRTIFDLVARNNLNGEIRSVSSNIFNLELKVLNYNNEVTMQKAEELGFVSDNKPAFVSQKSFVSLK